MSDPKRIAYVGQFKFPTGEACSQRTVNIARMLERAGHEVVFCTGQFSQFYRPVNGGVPPPFRTDYINYSEQPQSKLNKAFRFLSSGHRTVTWLQKQSPHLDAVILYGGYSLYASQLLPWCRRKGVPLIVDIVEWYHHAQLLGGAISPLRLDVGMALRYYFRRAGNIIAISRYLERYYHRRGCSTVRVPPSLDVGNILSRIVPSNSGPLTLAYTGVPGKKDLLNNVIEALLSVDPEGDLVRLTVAGPTPQTLLQLPVFKCRPVDRLPGCVQALGRLPHEEALDLVRSADFTVLLRPPLRYAQAGFPTKVPESLAVGTPVICNITSDLADYVLDGQTGLICKDQSTDAFVFTLKRALRLTQEQKTSMRHAARQTAELALDYRLYTYALDAFIQSAISRCAIPN